MLEPVGYKALIEVYGLPVLSLDGYARIDARVKGRQKQHIGGQWVDSFEPSYKPNTGLAGHLQFALRYEGINLQVMALLFTAHQTKVQTALCDWITANPESRYARVICFLYEWLTQQRLSVDDPVSPRARYVLVSNEKHQFCLTEGVRVSRFRVINNLPGKREFCPMVRKSEFLQNMIARDLQQHTQQVLASYDQQLLSRAAAYLYLKETQSSFEVEREKPSPQRAQRFADLLRQADSREPLTQDRLVELQNAVLDPRFHEYTWRSQQNWIGKDLAYRQQVDFVPARPEDVISLMQGLLFMANNALGKMDAVVLAAVLAFGFVYIHPFMDGNGRIHRYLIHDVLAKNGFTPRGIVLPVSAVILASIDEYIETLEHFSRPLNRITEFNPDTPQIPATGNDAIYFRYPDFTRQVEFLYKALERTVQQDLQQEINYLLGFDAAYKALNNLMDWPAHSLELFIQVVHANQGALSANKRKSHFDWMQENEIAAAEACVQEAFSKSNFLR
jgi:Fic family protein